MRNAGDDTMRAGLLLGAAVSLLLITAVSRAEDGELWAPLPVVAPGKLAAAPPSDAIVLFDGSDFSQWTGGRGWKIVDGAAVVGSSWLTTKRRFGDCQVHLEWSAPLPVVYEGARRGNSGVFMMGKYELQIMDSYQNATAAHRHAGAVYKQTPPAVLAVRPPGDWNSLDIFWTAPSFKQDGTLQSPAYVTAVLNGVLILNHVEVQGKTSHTEAPAYKEHEAERPFSLQNHGCPVRFRNIWARDHRPASRLPTAEVQAAIPKTTD